MKTAAANCSLKTLFRVIAITVFCAPLALAAKSSVTPERALADAQKLTQRFSDWSIYRASGESMAPRFDEAHLLLVKKARGTELQAGMVALFYDAEGDLVAHTVTDNDGLTLGTKGLNNGAADPVRIEHRDVVGVLVGTLAANAPFSDALELPVALGKTY